MAKNKPLYLAVDSDILRALAPKEKITIIISSHNLAELEHTCDVIGLINNGRIIEHKTMEDINKLVEARQRVQLFCNYPNYAAMLIRKKYAIASNIVGNSVILPLKESNLASVVSYLTYKKIKIFSIKKIQKSLEELYFELLNGKRKNSSIV